MHEQRAVGIAHPRLDGVGKATGRAKYSIDLSRDDVVHGVAVRARRAHARITGIDASAALHVSGVLGIVTADDLGGPFPRFGHIVADHPVLAIEKVRYNGEPVALVLGETPWAAHDGALEVLVDYEILP